MPPFCCFVILTSVILHLSRCTIHSGASEKDLFRTKRAIDGDDWIRALLRPEVGFLAGENTPVWLATGSSSPGHVDYDKLEPGVVKKAFDFWKWRNAKGSTCRRSSCIRESFELLMHKILNYADKMRSGQTRNSSSNNEDENRNKQSTSSHPDVRYLSILVMMDYGGSWPQAEVEPKFIYERILYALAFWNGVDLRFRLFKTPAVRLRIAGIVIGRNREATPYLRQDFDVFSRVKMPEAVQSMMNHWATVTLEKNSPLHQFHIIATMTDATEAQRIYINTPFEDGDLCQLSKEKQVANNGVIVPDNLAFRGIRYAVRDIAHALGLPAKNYEEYSSDSDNVLSPFNTLFGRKWSKPDLSELSRILNVSGSCMKEPLEPYLPGKPIETILPGRLAPASVQCQGHGYEDGYVCWDRTTCDALFCANNGWHSPCRNVGPPVDGTDCSPGKMCLDGICMTHAAVRKSIGDF